MIKKKGYCVLGKKRLPRGSNCFYLDLKNGYGLKIFYGLDKGVLCSGNAVYRVAKRMAKFYKLGLATKPKQIKEVALNFSYNGNKIKETCFAILTRHLDMKYDKGKKAFKKKILKVCKENKIEINKDITKDVNIGFDHRKKAFRLVDVA